MAIATRTWRALAATPFLLIAYICVTKMDLGKMGDYHAKVLVEDEGRIEWEGGSLNVPLGFLGVDALDLVWRGAAVTFSPSSLGHDPISWWQMVSFLTDLGPVYAVWFLESTRAANAWTPAYFATLWAFLPQLIGIGTIAPLFYFLCLVFGPSAADLATGNRTLTPKYTVLLLPLIFILHNLEIFGAYLSPDLETRHYWVWVWQVTPLWIGVVNIVGAQIVGYIPGLVRLARPKVVVEGACVVSGLVFILVLLKSPYSLSEIFVPTLVGHEDLVRHTRQALQYDQLCSFGASFLWLGYQLVDHYREGHMKGNSFWPVSLLPVVVAFFGPGVAFGLGWLWRERILSMSTNRSRKSG